MLLFKFLADMTSLEAIDTLDDSFHLVIYVIGYQLLDDLDDPERDSMVVLPRVHFIIDPLIDVRSLDTIKISDSVLAEADLEKYG